jgi:predicted transporter
MYTGFQHLHSALAYVVLLLLIIAITMAKYGFFFKKPFTETQRKVTLFALIGSHVQLLIGLAVYFISPLGFSNLSGETMGDSMARLYALEHPLINIIALVLITVGFSTAKRMTEDKKKHFRIVLMYGFGLLLILSRIPWGAWLN